VYQLILPDLSPPLPDDEDMADLVARVAAEEPAHERKWQATLLIGLAAEAELWHTPEQEAYATLPIDGHRETWPLRTRAFRRWLARQFYRAHDKAPGSQTVQDALGVLEGQALFDGPEYPVYTRLAEYNRLIYLDLANESWEAVEITPSGWRIVADPQVKFRRARGMLPLPHPVPGGTLEDLRPLTNIGHEANWRLVKGYLVQMVRPKGPYPILALHGEQGAAKSTLSRMIRSLADPNTAPLRSTPRDERDLAIAANNGWVVALDNLSGIPPWLSDALSRLSTGGGFGTRELYSDDEEKLFDAMRPIIINGIEELATRGDLLDRSVVIYLSAIDEAKRKPEDEVWRAYYDKRPSILGALLDAVAMAMRKIDSTTLDGYPRMADFAKWVAAASDKLGMTAEDFLTAYRGNRAEAPELALEASLITPYIKELAENGITGTTTALLGQLNDKAPEDVHRRKEWPTTGRALSNALRRLAPNLRAVGVDVTFDRSSKARTIILKTVVGKSSSP
jgi:hypothetical protein